MYYQHRNVQIGNFILEPDLTYVRKMISTLPGSAMFEIPEPYQRTFNKELFLARNILIRGRKRMLIFCTKTELKLLFHSPMVMMDGTFSATSPFSDQIYSIHALKYDTSNKYAFFDLSHFYFFIGFPRKITHTTFGKLTAEKN
jgi:hypothetical protein